MIEIRKCNQCSLPSNVDIEYGTDEGNKRRGAPLHVTLCVTHAHELWMKCEPIVNAGLMIWSNCEIKGHD